MKDFPHVFLVIVVVVYLMLTIANFVKTWAGICHHQNGEFFHGSRKIGILGFQIGALLAALALLLSDISLVTIGIILTVSAIAGACLSRSAKLHFSKQNGQG